MAEEPPQQQATKKCKYCGEQILAVAVKCKHCKSDLYEAQPLGSNYASEDTTDYGIVLLGIPVLGTLLVWFWIGQMNIFSSPVAYLWLVSLSTVVATAILAGIESTKIGMESSKDYWLLKLLFMWIVFYPLYLYKRAEYGVQNFVVAGTIVAVIFVGSLFSVGYSIDTKLDQLAALGNNLQTNSEQLLERSESISTEVQESGSSLTTNDSNATSSERKFELLKLTPGVYTRGRRMLMVFTDSRFALGINIQIKQVAGEFPLYCKEGDSSCFLRQGTIEIQSDLFRLVIPDEEDCAIYAKPLATSVSLRHISGDCGMSAGNRGMLAEINGTYIK